MTPFATNNDQCRIVGVRLKRRIMALCWYKQRPLPSLRKGLYWSHSVERNGWWKSA